MNAYTPRSALFAASVHFLPHVAGKPLGTLDENEKQAAIKTAVTLANSLAKELNQGSWTVAPLPNPKDYTETPANTRTRPEWIRMPGKGRCPYCGLARSTLWRMLSPNADNGYRAPVWSIMLRKRGTTRGPRLINYDSLMAHLASMKFDPKDVEPAV